MGARSFAWTESPIAIRVVPFILFVGLTFFQGKLGPGSPYWMYALKTVVGAVCVWIMWGKVKEMRWNFHWFPAVAGVAVFALWVGLNPFYPKLGDVGENLWNPFTYYGESSTLAWAVIVIRMVGVTLIVPPLEEVFYRSFIYRYIISAKFEETSLRRFDWRAFVFTSVIFGFAHFEWLAGILCGMAFQGLVLWRGRLGDAIFAHAVTNLLLGGWVLWKGAWQFW